MTSTGLPEFMKGVVDTDRSTWPQCAANEIWEVGKHLDALYPTPTDDELCALWREHMGVSSAVATKSVFGVYSPPDRPIKAVASVDLCETIRNTQQALYNATGEAHHQGKNGLYSEGTWFDVEKVGHCRERSVVKSVLRVLMNAGLIEHVEGNEDIAGMLRRWRKAGVWVVANTSTLPGCEPGTIKYTLGEAMERQFDALVLPRNHNGDGDMSKAAALTHLMQEAGITDVPILHFDDAPHHHAGFKAARSLAGGEVHLFAPPDGESAGADYEFDTPLETFRGANALFNYLGVTK